MGFTVAVKAHAADLLHQRAQHDEVDVAIEKLRTRSHDRLLGEGHAESRFFTLPRLGQVQVTGKTGVVGEQLADGDILFAVLRELRNVFCHWIIQPNFSFLEQLHHRRRGRYYLGQRSQVEDRAHGHRFAARLQSAGTECLAVDDAAIVPDQNHGSGDLLVVDGLADDGINRAQMSWLLVRFRRLTPTPRRLPKDRQAQPQAG